jgi:hypothetical protein
MGALCTTSNGGEETTVFKYQVGKEYEELKDEWAGEGIKRTAAWKAKISRKQLLAKRDEFWHSRTEGSRRVWVVIKQAIEADHNTAAMLLDAADITVENECMTVLFDRHGIKYEIPIYVINDPIEFTEGKMAPSRRKKERKEEDISFKIRCFHVASTDTELTMSNCSNIDQVKQAFFDKTEEDKRIPVDKMRVFFGGKELKDEETLIDNGIRKHMVV